MLTQFGVIEGQVRDARTHAPIAQARVELWTLQTPLDQRHTNTDGRFSFANLSGSDYSIWVSYAGYQATHVEISTPLFAFPMVIEIARKETSSTNVQPSISLREYLVPKSARKEFDLARKEVTRQDCLKAITHFEKGLRVFDQDASVHNQLGNCYRQLGRLDRAEESFLRARALSDSVYVALNLAEVYTAQKRFKEAESVLLTAVKKDSNIGDGYYGLALIYLQQGRVDDAEAALLRADTYPHQIADVHLVLAEIYWQRQKSSDAVKELKRYLEEAPNGMHSERVRQILKQRQQQ